MAKKEKDGVHFAGEWRCLLGIDCILIHECYDLVNFWQGNKGDNCQSQLYLILAFFESYLFKGTL